MKHLALLFLIMLPSVTPSPAPTAKLKPTTPFGVGKLTYTDGGDVWIMDGDGSNRVHVIDAGTNDTAPVWSPDGSKIAFTSDRAPSSSGGVWVVNADGTGLTLVTYIPGDRSADPTWSPDGTKIAFTSRRDTLIASIYIVNADGSNLTRLTNQLPYSDVSPDWSPDGSKIVFETNQGLGANMAVINADGTGRVLLGGGQYPEWSPDSSKILYSKPVQDAGLQLFVMNADGTGVTQLTSGIFDDHYPAWRYDGQKIAFVRNLSGTTRIWTMNANGTGQINITSSIQNAGQSFPDWQFLTPTAAPSTINGSVINTNGTPVSGVVINLSGSQSRKTITDSEGNYRFDNVETNGFYTVTPTRVNHLFNPFMRTFSQLGETTSALFTALPSAEGLNPLDTPEYLVRQHYLDFLGREPDEAGFNFWSDQMLECGADASCLERRRINVSAAYFLSIEFQETGGLVDGLYRASYGRRPRYAEFIPDSSTIARGVIVGRSNWQQQLEANKQAFVEAWVQRSEFHDAYDGLSNADYVTQLIAHTGVSYTTSERDLLITGLTNGTLTRATALRRIVENGSFARAKFNEAFVMMQYFGYLRRDPDESGYQFWLNKLNQFNGNFEQAEMVKAFLASGEYRARF